MKSLFLLLSILPFNSYAQWKVSGSAGPYLNALTFPSTTQTPTKKSGIYAELRLEKKIDSNWRFKSEFIFRNDFLAKDQVERIQWPLRNFYLQRKFKALTVRAGYQLMAIDGPDFLNPADVVHAKNWVDPTSPITMGSPGLSLSQEKDVWNWELFYIPYQVTSVLPGQHSPWLPGQNRLPIDSQNLEMRIPQDVTYRYLPGKTIQNAQSNNVAFKLQRKTEKLETQILYYDGLAQSPFVLVDASSTLIQSSPKTILLLDSPIGLRPLYYRQQVMALTFMIPLGSWAIKGGGNWLKPQKDSRSRTPTESKTGTLGLEKSFQTSWGTITAIAQYIRQENLSKNQISFLRSIFEKSWAAGVRVPIGEETTFYAGGLYDEVGRASMYQASLQRRLSNSWTIEGGGKMIQGPKTSLLGLYDKYDSYQLKAMYYW